MLVGFSGAAGSGKTTLVREVAKKLEEKDYRVAVVEEVARRVFEEFREEYGVQSLSELRENGMYAAFQCRVFTEQIAAEEEAKKKADIVLCDRTVYDNLMYTLLWCDVSTIKAYHDLFRVNVDDGRYDIIFLCEPVSGDVDDGFRTPDIGYRETQEWLLRLLLPGNYFYLPALPLEKRVEAVWVTVDIMYRWKKGVDADGG